jgi:hypothetical protein
LILNDFGFPKKEAAASTPLISDFGLMSGSWQPLFASHSRSEGFRFTPQEPFPTQLR